MSIIGDLHSNIPALRNLISASPLHSVLAVGDLCIYTTHEEAKKDKKSYEKNKRSIDTFLDQVTDKQIQSFDVPVVSILGNHDNFVNLDNDVYDDLKLSYVTNGKVLKIGNMVIATLGGIFSPKKFEWKTDSLHEYNRRFFTQEDIDDLLQQVKGLKVDILLTHQAPSRVLPELPSRADEGSPHLLKLLDEIKPKYHIHGHHHIEYTTTRNDTTVIGLGNFNKNNKTAVNFNIVTGEIMHPAGSYIPF